MVLGLVAIETVYPRVLHQRCWVHKMRNLRHKGPVRDRDELKQMAQTIYLAADRKAARAAFRRFKLRTSNLAARGDHCATWPGTPRSLNRNSTELLC